MCFLTEPTVQYKDSYIEAVREMQGEKRHLDQNIRVLSENFEAFVYRASQPHDYSTRTTPRRIPNADFWLIDDGVFVGRLNLRYELTPDLLKFGGHIGYEIRPSRRGQRYGTEILRLGLEKAKEAGLQSVLLTCDENNIGSKKIIEHNGGQFENAVTVTGTTVKKLRYWIVIS